jgi:uncharacterized protein YegP (UPF0339 family)
MENVPRWTRIQGVAHGRTKELEMTSTADKWEFYTDAQGMWRWRRTAPNGKIVGSSTEVYRNRADCEANARRNGWTG